MAVVETASETEFAKVFKAAVPAHVPPDLVREFSVFKPPLADTDPHAGHKLVQRDNPKIFYTSDLGGYWVLTDADYISEAIHTPEHFSSWCIQIPLDARFPVPVLPAESDDPEHATYRKLLNPRFSPRAVNALEQKLRASLVTLIDGVKDKGGCEFVNEIAQKFPVHAFLELAGLPTADAPQLIKWLHMMYHATDIAQRGSAAAAMYDYLEEKAEEFRKTPNDGLISYLAHSEIDGEPIKRDTLRSLMFAMVVGGIDTVTETMSYTMKFLATHPEHRQRLIDEPDLIPDAMEEIMRRFSVIWMIRTAKEDFEFHGVKFKKDDQFVLLLDLISLDERKSPNPLEVDFDRGDSSLNAAFNLGIHRCAGSHLARLELRLFLEEWLKRIPHFEIKEGTTPDIGVGMMVIFMNSLYLSW